MMIRLHQILSHVRTISGEQKLNDQMGRALDQAKSAMCFDLGDASGLQDMFPDSRWRDELKLPYRVCYFEITMFDWVTACIAIDRDDGVQVFSFVQSQALGWCFVGLSIDICNGMYGFAPENAPAQLKQLGAAHRNAIKCFNALKNCTNVDKVEHLPSTKLNAKRAREGKVPLFSFWTLVLKGKSATGEWLGGTHASPRVHLRRGHIREYEPGKTCWVQPCVVGDPSRGMVHKDYAIEALALDSSLRAA